VFRLGRSAGERLGGRTAFEVVDAFAQEAGDIQCFIAEMVERRDGRE
jgi:hypothetical protein